MADIKEYPGIMAAADDFRQLINTTVRDLCHAYLTIVDRNDYESCVRTLTASRKALCDTLSAPAVRVKRKDTGIGKQSLVMTLGQLARTAEHVLGLFEKVDDDGSPDEISSWLAGRGKELIRCLAYLIGDLLSEQNLHKILQKVDPAS